MTMKGLLKGLWKGEQTEIPPEEKTKLKLNEPQRPYSAEELMVAYEVAGFVFTKIGAKSAAKLEKATNTFTNTPEMLQQTALDLIRTGNAYWYCYGEAKALEIWVIPSRYVSVVPDATKFISGYHYECGGVTEMFNPEEMVHIRLPSPVSVYYGSPYPVKPFDVSFDQVATRLYVSPLSSTIATAISPLLTGRSD